MSIFKILAFTALLVAPSIAIASQGSGTGGDSAGSGFYLSSQGSGTGGDSVGSGFYLSSQGSGTGGQSQGSGTGGQSQGSGTGGDAAGGSSYSAGAYARQTLQQQADKLSCFSSFRCLFNIEK